MTGSGKDSLRAELLAIFREEATDHLCKIAAEMAVLETQSDSAAARPGLDRLFRTLHTLKGAARSLSVTGVEQACHEAEDLCADLVHGRVAFDDSIRAELVDLIDTLTEATRRALGETGGDPWSTSPVSLPGERPVPSHPADAPPAAVRTTPIRQDTSPDILPPGSMIETPVAGPVAPPAAAAVPEAAPPVFVRLEGSRIQRLGLMAEDLMAPRLASEARTLEARRLHARLAATRRDPGAPARRTRDDSPAIRREADALRGAEEAARGLATALAEDNRALRTLVDTLMVELRRARMMPAGDMLATLPEMVADLGQALGKTVTLHTSGTALLIDRQVADLLKDPLIHAIRNAIDHGI